MHIEDDQHLLMIEPNCPRSAEPIIDDITRKITAAWRSRETRRRFRGWHDCTGRGCTASSDNGEHFVLGRETHSLCVHYVARHRDDVPQAMLDEIAEWNVEGVEPTAEEIQ